MRKPTQLLLFILLFILNACAAGRPQIPVGEVPPAPVPSKQERSKAEDFKRELRESGLLTNERKYTERVENITNRILSVVETSHSWDTFVIKEDSFNAATLLGSIIIVNTGLLDKLSDDNEVAAVMAHEVAHSLASHFRRTGGEVANEVIAGLLGIAVGAAAVDRGFDKQEAEETMQVTQAIMRGAIVNPHSREREREADKIGIFAMADAGYDPRAAVRIWERMAEQTNSGSLAFFSTHPPSQERAALLKQLLPRALSRYEKSRGNKSSSLPKVTLSASAVDNVRKIKNLHQSKSIEDDSIEELLIKSKKFINSGNYSRAEATLRNVLQKDKRHSQAVYLLGHALLEQNKNKEAGEFLIRAVALNFTKAEPAYDFARVKIRSGDKKNALIYITRACSLDNSFREKAGLDPDFLPIRNDPSFKKIVKK